MRRPPNTPFTQKEPIDSKFLHIPLTFTHTGKVLNLTVRLGVRSAKPYARPLELYKSSHRVYRGTRRSPRDGPGRTRDAARGTRSGPPWGEEPGAYFGRVVYWGVPVSQDDNLTLVLMDELMPLVSVVSTCIHFP